MIKRATTKIRLVPAFVIIVMLLIVAACSVKRPAVPAGHPQPYKVYGRWYKPLKDAKQFTQTGKASWYGKKFHGRKTASGAVYNMYAMTAAHKTLPLNTWVTVIHRKTGKTVRVLVNDRGPFVKDRVIDLSYAAAKKLGIVKTGTAPVRVTLGKPKTSTCYGIQLGSFSRQKNAEKFAKRLKRNYHKIRITTVVSKAGKSYKVSIGCFSKRSKAEKMKSKLRKKGYKRPFIVQFNPGRHTYKEL